MVATRLGLEGYGVRRAGSFVGKAITVPDIEPVPVQPRVYPPYPGLVNLTVAELNTLKDHYRQVMRWARKAGSRNQGIRGTDIRRCQDKIREIDVELRRRKPIRPRPNSGIGINLQSRLPVRSRSGRF